MAEFRKKVDSDWKKKAALEKEALTRKKEQKERGAAAGNGPKPSFIELIRNFAAQAQLAMGFLEDPATGQRHQDPATAQFAIGMLELLQEKTAGNLDPQEKGLLDSVVSELKMAYIRTMG